MNLPFALSCAGWRFTLRSETRPLASRPEVTEHITVISAVAPGQSAPVELVRRTNGPTCLQDMLAALMEKNFASDPTFAAWRKSQGRVPVRLLLNEEGLAWVGEPMHTGLRKCADSPQSVITWNALHRVHADDRIALWGSVAQFLREKFADGRAPQRRALAQALADKVARVLDDRRHAACEMPAGAPKPGEGRLDPQTGRTPEQEFSLSMLRQGVALTDIEEWMWAWLGFVVEDLPTPTEAAGAAETAA